MPQGRQTAPSKIRRDIAQCLRQRRYRIRPEGQRYLDLHGLFAEVVVDDLADEIERFEIFRMSPQSPGDRVKFDYVIRYDDPKLLIHVKMTPIEGALPVVFLGFHSHNIPGPPLPRIPIHENDEDE